MTSSPAPVERSAASPFKRTISSGRVRDTVMRIVTLAVVLTAWEFYGRGVSRASFAPLSEVAVAAYELITSGVLLDAFTTSGAAFVTGFVAAAVVGILVGIVMGRSRLVEHFLDPYVSFLYSVPGVALIPLLVIWFGIGNQLRLAIVFLSCVFSIIINTKQGVKEVDPDLLDVAEMSCATELDTVRTVVIPHALPYMFTGLQVGLAEALVGVIVAEITAVVTGLGGLIIRFGTFFQTPEMLVPIITIGAASSAIALGMKVLRARLMPWEEGLETE